MQVSLGRRVARAGALTLALIALGCSSGTVGGGVAAEDEVTLHFVVTTDVHGHLRAKVHALPEGGELREGGAALLGGYVANLRRKRPGRVVLLDVGDTLTGTLEANHFGGSPVVRAYGLLGYDAMALGNHEFDLGRAVLEQRAAEASFPILAANVMRAGVDSGRWSPPGLEATRIVERDGIRVGLLGLATEETKSTTMASHVSGLRFVDPLPVAQAKAAELREAGAQVVVALLHDGASCKRGGPPEDLSRCDLTQPLFRLAKGLEPGSVDLLLGGHTHSHVVRRVGDLPVVVAGYHGRWFGRVDLTVSRSKGRVLPKRTVLHPLQPVCERVYEPGGGCDPRRAAGKRLVAATYEGAPVRPDGALRAQLEPVFAAVAAVKARPLGAVAASELTRAYRAESELGNLICDALLKATPEAQVALFNAGGIRANVDAGPITFGDLHAVLPFGNRVSVVQLSGAQLLRVIVANLKSSHGALQVGGMVVSAGAPGSEPVLTLADGTQTKPDGRYAVVTNDYLASGGSAFGALIRAGVNLDSHDKQRTVLDVVAAYLAAQGAQGQQIDSPDAPLLDPQRPRLPPR